MRNTLAHLFRRYRRPVAAAAFAVATVATVAGCYLPVRFDSEIEFQRTGLYTAIFDGYVADIGIYDELKSGKLGAAEEKEKADRIIADLTRSSDVSNAKYMQNGIFHVTWKHKGDIIAEKMHTFIRRNEAFLTLKYLEDEGRIVISGRKLKNTQVEQLEKIGLGSVDGQLRIKTAATVADHNATTVKKRKTGGFIYTWNITSFKNPAPKMVVPVR